MDRFISACVCFRVCTEHQHNWHWIVINVRAGFFAWKYEQSHTKWSEKWERESNWTLLRRHRTCASKWDQEWFAINYWMWWNMLIFATKSRDPFEIEKWISLPADSKIMLKPTHNHTMLQVGSFNLPIFFFSPEEQTFSTEIDQCTFHFASSQKHHLFLCVHQNQLKRWLPYLFRSIQISVTFRTHVFKRQLK